MAIEKERGCGYRKVGGMYLMAGKVSAPCDRLPFELTVCECCGEGYKQSRGIRYVQPTKMLGGTHPRYYSSGIKTHGCNCLPLCPACNPNDVFGEKGKAALMWIGAGHYPTPDDFIKEGAEQGISKRLSTVPKDFKIGETVVFFAHPKALLTYKEHGEQRAINFGQTNHNEAEYLPGIICTCRPDKIEKLVLQSEYDDWYFINHEKETRTEKHFKRLLKMSIAKIQIENHKKLQKDIDRGLTLIAVPDDDKDHQ